ncbi:MAG: hypothetical protein ILP19_05195 [Oscillospiraceae bacterium]|nr:hypothetical protein [Oscillospiraceae bacterium]
MIFEDNFTIGICTSGCREAAVRDIKFGEIWHTKDITFESGKIYGLISEYGQGCMYLSYLLGGQADPGEITVTYNGAAVDRSVLEENSLCLEPAAAPYGKKTVRKAIESALAKGHSGDFQSLADRFMLTPERYGRRFTELSGERMRAAAAYGCALGKRIDYAPYNPSGFYHRMCASYLYRVLRELASYGALVVLPCGSDAFLRYITDELIYLDPGFDGQDIQ